MEPSLSTSSPQAPPVLSHSPRDPSVPAVPEGTDLPLNGGNKETLLSSGCSSTPKMLFGGCFMSLSPSSTASCPVPRCHSCHQHHLSPHPAPFLDINHSQRVVFLFLFSAHKIQAQLCSSSFPDKLFRSCKEPFFFFFIVACLHFSAILEAGRRVPGQAAVPGLPGAPASPRVASFIFLTQVLVHDNKTRHQNLALLSQSGE